MTKLRNIGYLRFGSKIRQNFAGEITSLTPPLSLSPLWISWAENEGAREGAQLLYLGGSLPPLHRAPGRGAAGSHQGPLRKNNLYLFTCESLPQSGRGTKL